VESAGLETIANIARTDYRSGATFATTTTAPKEHHFVLIVSTIVPLFCGMLNFQACGTVRLSTFADRSPRTTTSPNMDSTLK
jgi:hypothetical protein